MFFSSNKLLKLIISIFVFFIVTYLCFDLIFNLSNNISTYLKQLPSYWISAVFIYLVLTLDILIPVPSSIVMVTSGSLFGGLLGALIAIAGSMTCSIFGFYISRRMGAEKVKKWLGEEEFNKMSNFFKKYGAYTVILSRIVPLAMESISCIAGLSKMSLKKYIISCLLGFIPLTLLYTYTGAIYGDQKSNNIFLVLVIGFFIPIFLWFLIIKISKIKKQHG